MVDKNIADYLYPVLINGYDLADYVADYVADYLYPVLVNGYDRVIYISSYIQVKLSRFRSMNNTKFSINTASIQPMCVTSILCTHTNNESHTLENGDTCDEDGVVTIDYAQKSGSTDKNIYNIMRNSYAYDPGSIDSLIASIDKGCATLTTANPLYAVVLVTVVSGNVDLGDLFVKLAGPYNDFRDNLNVTLDSLLVTLKIDCNNDGCNNGSWYFYGPHGCSGIPVSDSDLFTIQHVLNVTGCNQQNHLEK
jgi:hypothetical protein